MDIRLKSITGRGLVLATVLGSSLATLDGSVVNVALPHIGRDLHSPLWGLQWTVNAYLLPLAAFVLLGGALGDRFGRRKIFLLGVIWFTVASVLCGLATGIGWLVGARALQGIGSALLTPGSLSLIQSSLHPDDRARAIGLWAGLGGVAAAGGPLLGGYLIDALNWRWIFFINVPLALIAIVATMRFVPESHNADETGRFDVLGAVLGAVGLGGITFALVEGKLWAGLAGAAVLVAFIWWERRQREPMMPTGLFRSVEFSVINLVTLLIYGALGGLIFFFILQLQLVVGLSAFAAGAATLPLTIILLLGSPRAAALGNRIGARIPLALGAAIAAVGVALLLRVGAGSNYWADVFGPIVVSGLGLTLLVAPLTSTVLAAAPTPLAGVASGINNAVARSGSLLAVAALPLAARLSGTDYSDPVSFDHGYRIAIAACAGLLVVSALLSWFLLPAHKRDAAPEPEPEAAAVS